MTTVPSPRTWAVGETVTAANLNLNLRDATNFLIGGAASRRPAFRVVRGAAQAIPTATETQVLWDNVVTDNDAGYSLTTGLYTVNTAGIWLFQVSTTWNTSSTGNRGVHLNANGYDAWAWMSAATDSIGRSSTSLLVNIGVSSAVSSSVYQNTGASLNFVNGPTTFAGIWLSS